MSSDGKVLQDDDFMLDDEDENFLTSGAGHQSGLRMSATTDTLDSVILEASPDDNPEKEPLNILSSDEMSEQTAESEMSIDKTRDIEPVSNNMGIGKETDDIVIKTDDNQTSDLSSYFGAADSGDNFFDSIGNAGGSDDGKLGNDIFMSIAISKSEEDIRLSEMNAREIMESDVISESNKSPDIDEFPDLSRNQSFQDVVETMSVENLALKDGEVSEEASIEQVEEEEDIIHIHHREHKSSTSEPEPISFEGESDILNAGQDGSSKITDLAEKKEFEEIMAQAEDIVQRPDFTTQVSSTSDKSESPRHSTTGQFNNMPNVASSPSLPSSSESKLHPTGPVVGTTPSQMSPMGTPVHQSDTTTTVTGPASPQFADPPGFHTQTSVPGSPFHNPLTQDIRGGNNTSIFAPFGNTSGTDDAFNSILSMSDSDRRHDAWIPSDATSHILFTMATKPPGTFTPAQEQLSTPGILNNERQGDPVRDLVLRYMGEQEAIKRSVLTVESVTQDVDGLKKLIEAGCLRAAIDLTGRLLEQVGQGNGKANSVTVHTPHSLQLWFVRLTLMVKLRMFEQAEAEMRPFQTLDTPDLYFQFYPSTYPGRRGSMVSFSMRLLHAELPLLCGRSQESLDRLYYMMAVCTRIKSNLSSDLNEDGSGTHMTYEARKVSLELWNQRELQILYKIAATMLSVKDYEGALAIYNSLLEKEKNAQLELKAGIGRIHLQMGNINEAAKIIKDVESESSKGDSSMPCFHLLNKGLVAMCSNNFQEAYQHFKSAVQIQPHNTCAVNNMAVCSLYLGRLKDALNTLEQLVHSDPANTLHEGVLFNLCTLYELETSRALHKKQAILDLVNKHKGDGFPVACLKMA